MPNTLRKRDFTYDSAPAFGRLALLPFHFAIVLSKSPASLGTSHTPGALSEIPTVALERFKISKDINHHRC